MAYYLMLNRRDDWGAMHTYRYGKAYKDMKAAIRLCKKHLDSFIINDKNICVFINTSTTRMVKPRHAVSPLGDDYSDFL